ncbi:MAG: V-type ATP synthase subunit I [Chlamydiota bacterium]
MRVDLRKYLFVGVKDVKDSFFEQAQEEGIVHFIDSDATVVKELPESIQHVTQAIKVLRGLPTTEQEISRDYSLATGIAEKVLELKHQLDKLQEDERVMKLEIARIEIFGDFEPNDIHYIEREGKRKIQFYCAKKGVTEKENFPQDAIYVGSSHGLDYFVTIRDRSQQFDGMIEMNIDEPVTILNEKLSKIQNDIRDVDQRLKGYEKYNEYLHHALIDKMNHHHLSANQEFPSSEMDDSLFVVEGWVPENKVDHLDDIVKGKQVYYDEVAIEDDDTIPTCLQNEGASRIGEDLVNIYDTPSNTDNDPSLWVLGFFSLFFAFIVGDGGYGFIFLAVALYFRFKLKNIKKVGKRFLNLVTILAVSCILWGFLTTSFFGISFGPDSPMQKFSAVNWLDLRKVEYHYRMQDDTIKEWTKQFPQIQGMNSPQKILESAAVVKNGQKIFEMYNKFSDAIMLELALVVGMIHIILSFARYIGRNWAGVGWILFIIGGYMYFPYYLGTASMLHYVFGMSESYIGPQGLYVLITGLSIAIFLSVVQNKLFGLLEITTLVQVFGDILSYLRLYALGLAGGIVSATVNELAGGLVFVAGFVVIILGHVINILLSVMGGVIHGLRLNFLEWYHYCFEGGGKNFTPLQKLEVD